MHKKIYVLFTFLIIFTLGASACGSAATTEQHAYEMASEDMLAEDIRSAPTEVKEAFQFAIANPDILSQIPCYCGCGGIGHMSNLDCYIKEVNPDGSIVFDYHAYG